MQAKSYSEVQDSSVSVSISGDVGEARSFQSQQQDNSGKNTCRILARSIMCELYLDDESGDSDAESGEKQRRVNKCL